MSFKSEKYKNLTCDQIINDGGETLNNLINSKHPAYKKFNEYYHQKKLIHSIDNKYIFGYQLYQRIYRLYFLLL